MWRCYNVEETKRKRNAKEMKNGSVAATVHRIESILAGGTLRSKSKNKSKKILFIVGTL